MNISPNMVSVTSQKASTAAASSVKPRATSSPSVASRPENTGTKAELNAPSPNRRRNRFGRRLATRNASDSAPAPRKAAISWSRMRPSTRLAMVQLPTVAMPFSTWQILLF